MTDLERWSEDDSELYARLAPIAVPARAEQLSTLATLLPFAPDDEVRIVELAAGRGELSKTLLGLYPGASLLALDGSELMREALAERLAPYGDRAQVGDFDIHATDWFDAMDGCDAVLSSLCVHHLDAGEKQRLFAEVFARLRAGGTLLLADLVLPQRPEATQLFGTTWDASASAQASAKGADELFRDFEAAAWNYFWHPDPHDKPSPLFDQLKWMEACGFGDVDCFWMTAGHAIYGGYKPGRQGADQPDFERALDVAQSAVS